MAGEYATFYVFFAVCPFWMAALKNPHEKMTCKRTRNVRGKKQYTERSRRIPREKNGRPKGFLDGTVVIKTTNPSYFQSSCNGRIKNLCYPAAQSNLCEVVLHLLREYPCLDSEQASEQKIND